MSRRRYELSDREWSIIAPLLPNKPRGVPHVDDRRVLDGILWRFRTGSPGGDTGAVGTADDLLQPLRAMAKGRRLGSNDGCHHRRV